MDLHLRMTVAKISVTYIKRAAERGNTKKAILRNLFWDKRTNFNFSERFQMLKNQIYADVEAVEERKNLGRL